MSSLPSGRDPAIAPPPGKVEPYETIGVEQLTPIIGAEIAGVDIGQSPPKRARTCKWTRSSARSPKAL